MVQPSKFLLDGVDRLGKSTLVKNIVNELGYHLVIHYDKPKVLNVYEKVSGSKNEALKEYQKQTNKQMFELMRSNVPIIFDRTHLGEMVYAPLYRNCPGDYVYQYEAEALNYKIFTHQDDFKLILLTTSNFDIMEDDGLSFDFSKKEQEQELFIQAFHKSSIVNKIIIDVHNGMGGFKHPTEVLCEALGMIIK